MQKENATVIYATNKCNYYKILRNKWIEQMQIIVRTRSLFSDSTASLGHWNKSNFVIH